MLELGPYMTIIDCVSDLHGHYPKLEGGDLLIVAGDLTGRDTINEYQAFCYWLFQQDYKRKIVISGNHDNCLERDPLKFDSEIVDCDYLCDSGTEMVTKGNRLKIWGSPWTKWFPEVNPKCTAFMLKTEEELAEKCAMIPDDTDILITHSPPYQILDLVKSSGNAGSLSLWEKVYRIEPKYHIFGHIHEWGGGQLGFKDFYCKTVFINASHVNERYEPVNKPVRIIL